MSKTTLKTNQVHRFNRKQVLPIVGEVHIKSDGTFEVEDSLVKDLLDLNLGFEQHGVVYLEEKKKVQKVEEKTEEKIKPQVQESEELQKSQKEDKVEEQVEQSEVLDNITTTTTTTTTTENIKSEAELLQDKRRELNSLRVVDLQSLVSDFPKTEWETLKKTELIDYIIQNLK